MRTKELRRTTANREVAERETKAERRRVVRPKYSIVGDPEKVVIRLEMPGVEKTDLNIHIEDNELLVEGRRPAPIDGRYLIRERADADFATSFTLDETIDQERVDAELHDGVLTLTLHVKEAVKPRKITIRTK